MKAFATFRRVWALLLLSVHWSLVLTYMVAHVRHRKHIAILQRGLAILLSENVAWLIISFCYVSHEWALTSPEQRFDSSPLVNLASAIWPGIGAVVSFTRAYVVLVKFTKLPPACRLIEVRTTMGQLCMCMVSVLITLVYWIALETAGPHFCFHICRQRNVIFQAHYLLAAPYNVVYNTILNATVQKCAAVGAMAETAGILSELERLGKFLSVTMISQVIFIIMMDAGLVPLNTPVQFFLFNYNMMMMFGLWTVLNLQPSIRLGYSPFPGLNAIMPEEEAMLLYGDLDNSQNPVASITSNIMEDDNRSSGSSGGSSGGGGNESRRTSANPVVTTISTTTTPFSKTRSPAPIVTTTTTTSNPMTTTAPASPSPVDNRGSGSGVEAEQQQQQQQQQQLGATTRRMTQQGGGGGGGRTGSLSHWKSSHVLHDSGGGLGESSSNSSGERRTLAMGRRTSSSMDDDGTRKFLEAFRWENLLSDEDKLEELWLLARTMLCEEAVRCMMYIIHLRHLGGHSLDDREQARGIYQAMVRDHLAASAIMPVDVSPWQRAQLVHILEVSARRRIIFYDDMVSTLGSLDPLAALLAPRANSVLRRFLFRSYGIAPPATTNSKPPLRKSPSFNNNATVRLGAMMTRTLKRNSGPVASGNVEEQRTTAAVPASAASAAPPSSSTLPPSTTATLSLVPLAAGATGSESSTGEQQPDIEAPPVSSSPSSPPPSSSSSPATSVLPSSALSTMPEETSMATTTTNGAIDPLRC